MKYRRWLVCWMVAVAVGLAGCSNEAEKLQLENQQLRKDNAALKKDLAAVSKSLENSLPFPAGWASQKSPAKELEAFEKPGTYEGTHDLTFGDGNRLHMKALSKVMYGNGGTCLVNATVETQEGAADPNYALQVLTYEQQQQAYRAINIFQNGSVSVSESRPEDALDGGGAGGQRKRKWHAVYNSNIPETAELETFIGLNKERDEVEWNWEIKEGDETMISGKGIKRRVE